MAREPADRPSSVTEFRQELTAHLGHRISLALSVGPPPRARPRALPSRPHPGPASLAAGAIPRPRAPPLARHPGTPRPATARRRARAAPRPGPAAVAGGGTNAIATRAHPRARVCDRRALTSGRGSCIGYHASKSRWRSRIATSRPAGSRLPRTPPTSHARCSVSVSSWPRRHAARRTPRTALGRVAVGEPRPERHQVRVAERRPGEPLGVERAVGQQRRHRLERRAHRRPRALRERREVDPRGVLIATDLHGRDERRRVELDHVERLRTAAHADPSTAERVAAS